MRLSASFLLLALSAGSLASANFSSPPHARNGVASRRATGDGAGARPAWRRERSVIGDLQKALGVDGASDDGGAASANSTSTSTSARETSTSTSVAEKSSTVSDASPSQSPVKSQDPDKSTKSESSSSDAAAQKDSSSSDSSQGGLLSNGGLLGAVGTVLTGDKSDSKDTSQSSSQPASSTSDSSTTSQGSSQGESSSSTKSDDSGNGGLLGAVGGLLTGDGGSTSTASPSATSSSSSLKDTSSSDSEPTSTAPTSTAQAQDQSNGGGLLGAVGGLLTGDGGSSSTASPTATSSSPSAGDGGASESEPTTTTQKQDGGLLGGVGSLLTGGGDDAPTTTSRDPDQATSSPTPTSDPSGSDSSSPSKDGGLIGGIGGLLTGTASSSSPEATPEPTPSESDEPSQASQTSAASKDPSEGASTPTQSDDGPASVTFSPAPQSTDAGEAAQPASSAAVTAVTTTAGDAAATPSASDAFAPLPTTTEAAVASAEETPQTTSGYWYADTTSLILPEATGTTVADDGSLPLSPSDSAVGVSATAVAQYPSTIVPADAAFVQPEGTTPVAILLKPTMRWTWLASNADTTAQVFAFMPTLIASAIGLPSDSIVTVRLQSYYPPGATSETQALTLFVAYVPSDTASKLQASIADTNSAFYTSAPNNVAKQLAANVDPSFNILVGGGQAKSTIVTGAQKPTSSNATLRNALIGVAAALVAVIAGVIGWRVWRKQQKAKAPPRPQAGGLGRNNTIRSFGGGGLRETWAPSVAEQERVLHGQQLTQTWESPEMRMVDGAALAGSASRLSRHEPHAELWSDPFHDTWAVDNRASIGTERHSDGGSSGVPSSGDGSMTEAQRIQQSYLAANAGSAPEIAAALGSTSYAQEYERPQQYTSSHAYGPPRAADNRSRKRGSRSSILSGVSIGQPNMTSNSMLL